MLVFTCDFGPWPSLAAGFPHYTLNLHFDTPLPPPSPPFEPPGLFPRPISCRRKPTAEPQPERGTPAGLDRTARDQPLGTALSRTPTFRNPAQSLLLDVNTAVSAAARRRALLRRRTGPGNTLTRAALWTAQSRGHPLNSSSAQPQAAFSASSQNAAHGGSRARERRARGPGG